MYHTNLSFTIFFVSFLFLSVLHVCTAAVDWPKITSQTLSSLQVDVFTNINATELGSIPPEAIPGFRSAQIAAINPTAGIGFTNDQIANMSFAPGAGCYGFTAPLMVEMNPLVFAGFTPDCVGVLPVSALNNWTFNQVSYLTPSAVAGFRSNIRGLNATAFSAFNSSHVSQFNGDSSTSACLSLQALQIQYLTSEAFSGWTIDCISLLSANAFSLISADQLFQLTPTAAGGMKASVLRNIPVLASPGWQGSTLEAIASPSSACSGFNASQIGAMLPEIFYAWTTGCIGALPGNAFSLISAEHLGNFTQTNIHALGRLHIQLLPDEAGSGWTADLLSVVSHSFSSDGCYGFMPAHVANMKGAAFAGWTSHCVGCLQRSAWAQTNADQINNLTVSGASEITAGLIAQIPPTAFAGFIAKSLSSIPYSLSSDGCFGITFAQVSSLKPEVFSGWDPFCIRALPNSAWNQTTAAQISYLSLNASTGLKSSLVRQMPGSTGAGWNAMNLAFVPSFFPSDGCHGFTAEQVGNMTTAAFGGWTQACLAALSLSSPLSFSSTNNLQISNLSLQAIPGMKGNLIRSIPAEASIGWSAQQIAEISNILPNDGCSGFSSSQVSYMPILSFSGWVAACISLLSPSIFQNINATQFSAFPITQYSGFTKSQFLVLPESIFQVMPLERLLALSPSAISGINYIKLEILVKKYGKDLVLRWDNYHMMSYTNRTDIYNFKKLVPSPHAYMFDTLPSNPTWLQVLFTVPAPLSRAQLNNFSSLSVFGITSAQGIGRTKKKLK